jgi:hypothetical protein
MQKLATVTLRVPRVAEGSMSRCLDQTTAFGEEQQRADVSRLRLLFVLSEHPL